MIDKIVLNKRYGKFNLSHEAIIHYAKLSGIKLYIWVSKEGYIYTTDKKGKDKIFTSYHIHRIKRADQALIQTVEELGTKVDDCWSSSRLEIEELIPNKIWYIEDYSGIEEIKYL